jgi:enamine deaminase RidA (YjgF/YER057c/UK114 family)
MNETFSFQHTDVRIFSFKPVADRTTAFPVTNEYHIMVRVTNPLLSFQEQLDAVLDTYQHLIANQLKGAVAVFKRYFLSDAANQADMILAADTSDCAKSLIQQPPLDGTKIALWAYLLTGVTTRITDGGLFEVKKACPQPSDNPSTPQYRHLWNASAHNLAANSEYQTRLLFNEYVMQLVQEDCTLAANCIRTWLFVNDIDLNYGGVVRARNQVFFTQGLTHNTHFIASTGIGGRAQDPCVLVQMDNYAIAGIKPEQIHQLYASTHLNRTSDYGVSFERGTYVDYGDRRHVIISGTASIDNKGQIVHAGDVIKQTRRMWENIEALLREGGCTYDDVAHMIVYLRDPADYAVVSRLYEERFTGRPVVIVQASVCRSGWLVEMECMAVKAMSDKRFPAF